MNKHTVDTFACQNRLQRLRKLPNIIQHPHTIARVELSGSSNDEFYEASPVYFPTLLDETNYPFVAVTTKPHMTQPLQECELNLEGVATTNFHAFPFGNDTRTADERALTKIIQHEMCHPTANPGGHHQIRGQTTRPHATAAHLIHTTRCIFRSSI